LTYADLARYHGIDERISLDNLRLKAEAAWDYPHTSAIMDEINTLPPPIGSITPARLERGKRLQ